LKYRLSFVSRTVLVLSALAALGAPVFDAQALGVGRLNVQSALGEGLRAEIDLISLSAEESASLSVRIASPEAYRQAGVDYSAVLVGTRAVVVQGADGRASLRLSSDRAVQEPSGCSRCGASACCASDQRCATGRDAQNLAGSTGRRRRDCGGFSGGGSITQTRRAGRASQAQCFGARRCRIIDRPALSGASW
jgi:hypothetical protein